jgi:hypothetical protein
VRTELRREHDVAAFALLDPDEDERVAALDLMFQPDGDALVRRVDGRSPRLDEIYAHFASVATDLVDEAARRRPAAWDAALEVVLDRAGHVDWWLSGSAALAVRGLPVAPRDLDLVATVSGAWELGERLTELLVEPLSTSADWVAEVFGRAYGPARIEWVGGMRAWVDEPEPGDLGPYAAARLETVDWRDHAIRVPPLELQLASSRQRSLDERVAAIEQSLGGDVS